LISCTDKTASFSLKIKKDNGYSHVMKRGPNYDGRRAMNIEMEGHREKVDQNLDGRKS